MIFLCAVVIWSLQGDVSTRSLDAGDRQLMHVLAILLISLGCIDLLWMCMHCECVLPDHTLTLTNVSFESMDMFAF